MGHRNRTAGHDWERAVAQMLRNSGIYPHAVTCRSTNRARDNEQVDFCNSNEAVQGRMKDDIQAKTALRLPDLTDLLLDIKSRDVLDERVPAVFWRKTRKTEGGRFITQGLFAVAFLEDYLKLLQAREALEALKPLMPALLDLLKNDPEHQKLVARLQELGI